MSYSIGNGDLPALHSAASTASTRAQTLYLRLLKLDMGALVFGALLTSVDAEATWVVQWTAAIGALLLVLGLLITMAISRKGYERRWYGGRAAAESVKTLAWRYATGAQPFSLDIDPIEADGIFVRELRSVLEQSDTLEIDLGGVGGTADQITGAMRALRGASLEDRKRVYLRDRVDQQRAWYTRKAERNAAREDGLFAGIMVAQFLAVLSALALVLYPGSPLSTAGLLTTAAAVLLAWLQVKRHQELSQSYSVAAHELGLAAAEAHHLESEDGFIRFVSDAESAISREHTLWVARRDVPASLRPS